MTDIKTDLNNAYSRFADVGGFKGIWYDWGNANEWLFHKINAIQSPTYDDAMQLLTLIGSRENFFYYLGALFIYALLRTLFRVAAHRGGNKHYMASWFGIFSVLIIGFAGYIVLVKTLKEEFHYPRPYAVLADVEIPPNTDTEKAYQSFPSGHAAFITLMVIALWPIMNSYGKVGGPLLIFGVAWSRIALGVHFPADVVYGFILMLLLTLLIRTVIYRIYFRMFGLQC